MFLAFVKLIALQDRLFINSEHFALGAFRAHTECSGLGVRVDPSVLIYQQQSSTQANWLTLASLLATSRHKGENSSL